MAMKYHNFVTKNRREGNTEAIQEAMQSWMLEIFKQCHFAIYNCEQNFHNFSENCKKLPSKDFPCTRYCRATGKVHWSGLKIITDQASAKLNSIFVNVPS